MLLRGLRGGSIRSDGRAVADPEERVRVCLDGDVFGGDIFSLKLSDAVRVEILTGEEALRVGELGDILGDVGRRVACGAGVENVGVMNGETGAGEYAGMSSMARGRSGTPDAGHTLSHMCSGDLSFEGEEARRGRLGPESGDARVSIKSTGEASRAWVLGVEDAIGVVDSDEMRLESEDSDNNRSRISCK